MGRNIKNILSVTILLLLFIQVSDAHIDDNRWSKINNFIYINRNSIKKIKYSTSGIFKIYNSPESELYSDGSNVYYEIVKYDVDCKDPSISIVYSKYYDKNHNLINEYVNKEGVGCIYPCLVYDEIYVRELCK